VIITGKYPLAISSIRVTVAKYLFPVLKTFVAPILPDPIFLISFLVKILVKIRPNGIDQHKYDNEIIIKISIFKQFY